MGMIKNFCHLPSAICLSSSQIFMIQIGLLYQIQRFKTQCPTAEQLLAAFGGITLYHHRDDTSEMTPLNDLQRRILALMKLPETIYVLPVPT